jgi:hypothetical protein
VVFNTTDAIAQGLGVDTVLMRHINEFYGEVGGNMALYVMLLPKTVTMAQMVDHVTNPVPILSLLNTNKKINLLAVFRNPDGAYDAGDDFLDADVANTLVKAQALAVARATELTPLRILIEGRIANETEINTFLPKDEAKGFCGVVIGGTLNDLSASVCLALGRAVKFAAHIKLGKVKNGALNMLTAYIGTKTVEQYLGLDLLHGQGFISFMKHPEKGGFYFGIDRMASSDDYRLLVYGRVIDKAVRVVASTYVDELEGEITIADDGTIDPLDVAALEGKLQQALELAMSNQASKLTVYINPAQNVIETATLKAKVRVKPLGYLTFIETEVGLTV